MEDLRLSLVRSRTVFKTTKGGSRSSLQGLFIVHDQLGGWKTVTVRAKHARELREKALADSSPLVRTSLSPIGSFWLDQEVVYKGCRVICKRSRDGSGLRVSHSVRKLLEAAGVRNASVKVYGRNPAAVLRAVGIALERQSRYRAGAVLASRSRP